MKKNGWMIGSALLLAGALLAHADGQLEPDKTSPPAEKSAKPVAAKPDSKAAAEKPIVLSPGAATITGNNVNVRGKAGYKGEVFTKLNKGDAITVIEQVILPKPKRGEPAQWAKIDFPAAAHVWVHSAYVDENKTVKPRKLNVRTGPGENYSIVGILEQGAAVKEISAKGNWLEIEPPAGAYAFVAASYVQQTVSEDDVPPVVSVAPTDTVAPPETADVTPAPDLASTTTDTPGIIATNPAVEPFPAPQPDDANAAPPPAVIEEIDVPRFVSHEGVVKGTVSIQAPTKFGLYSPETGKLINYLFSPTPQLEMSRYYGRHIIVSGEEGLDERWKNTPVLTIQKIYVVPK
jgi:uncharacterized protein YgiM (DUF1202 family)